MAGSARDPLYWDDAYPIALVLRAAHPDVDPISVELRVLFEWVVGLEDFADDPALTSSEWLERIQAEWIEL
ncbi:MAG: Fe-S cluster assembly protein IscX [Chloroflexi bacterium]|nr:Fe-S cluster assembly protein IscX [Chloroflexota bacterium]